jgi:hypothetical protein
MGFNSLKDTIMPSRKYGVRTIEWAKHLRNRMGTKRPQEKLVRADGKKQCRGGDIGTVHQGYSRDN